MLAIKFYWKPLLGCCSAWFLYDAVVYPFNLLAPTLVAGFSDNQTMQESIGWSALINFFALPGAFIGAMLMDRIGRRQTYALGWAIVCVFGFVIGGTMFPLSSSSAFPAFVTLYGLFQTFLSVGPGDCNFLVSSESFPTPLRGHFLGFAAAVGKAGAAVGTEALSKALTSFDDRLKGQQVVFLIGSGISVVGTLCVWFLIPNVSILCQLVSILANIIKAPQDTRRGGCSLPSILGGEWLRRQPDGVEGLGKVTCFNCGWGH